MLFYHGLHVGYNSYYFAMAEAIGHLKKDVST